MGKIINVKTFFSRKTKRPLFDKGSKSFFGFCIHLFEGDGFENILYLSIEGLWVSRDNCIRTWECHTSICNLVPERSTSEWLEIECWFWEGCYLGRKCRTKHLSFLYKFFILHSLIDREKSLWGYILEIHLPAHYEFIAPQFSERREKI